MSELPTIGRILIAAGAFLLIMGAALVFGDRIPFLGKLPGDILIRRENGIFYFPLTSSILLSIIISIILNLIRRK